MQNALEGFVKNLNKGLVQLPVGGVQHSLMWASAAFCLAALLAAQPPAEKRLRALIEKAQAAEKREDLAEAVRLYREILWLRPHWASAELNLALVYFTQKNYADSIRLLDEVVRHDPALDSAHLFLGLAYYQTDQYEQAVPSLKRYLERRPASPEARSALAAAYLGLHDYLSAALQYAEQIPHTQDHEDLYFRLGESYLEQARVVMKRLEEGSEPSPFFLLLSAEELLSEKDRARAEDQIRQAIALAPALPEAYVILGRCLLGEGKLAEAKRPLEQALQIDPQDCRARESLSRLKAANTEALRRPGELGPGCLASAASCEAAIPPRSWDSPSGHRMTLSNCLERRGDFRGATQALIAALSAAPADERTLYWSFHISKRLAQRAIMELAAAAPNSPSLGLLRAELFEQNGQYAEAEREYRSVIGRAGATAESFIRYGKFMCKTWRLEEAIPLYQRAMKLEPENPRVRGLIGEVHLLGERPETALPYLQAAVEARPRDEQSRLYLARCLDRLGRPQQAIAVLEAAPFDSDGRIHYALGSLYRLQGEQEKARQAFEEFRRRKGARR